MEKVSTVVPLELSDPDGPNKWYGRLKTDGEAFIMANKLIDFLTNVLFRDHQLLKILELRVYLRTILDDCPSGHSSLWKRKVHGKMINMSHVSISSGIFVVQKRVEIEQGVYFLYIPLVGLGPSVSEDILISKNLLNRVLMFLQASLVPNRLSNHEADFEELKKELSELPRELALTSRGCLA